MRPTLLGACLLAGCVPGCGLEVVTADIQGLPARGVAVMGTLIIRHGVVALCGGDRSSTGVASPEVADARGIGRVRRAAERRAHRRPA